MDSPVQAQYNRLATIYDRRWQFYIAHTLDFLVAWAGVAPTERVLDVACGTGELERRLSERHPQQGITGVDFSSEMLTIAQQKCAHWPTVRFQIATAEALPWAEPTFDVVLCANAFHYFEQPTTVLAEFQRVAANGRVVILDWCRDFWVCRLCDWVLGWVDPVHQRCYTEAELHALLRRAGYRIQRSQRLRFGLIWGLMAVETVME